MKTLFSAENILYSGKELRPHFIYHTFNIQGDAVVAFIGKAEVSCDNMVDQEDVKQGLHIYSPRMLHFLAEFYSYSLQETIALQRLFIAIIAETLINDFKLKGVTRKGDDIFIDDSKKLSVSIATRSQVSTLIHIGCNIDTDDVPVLAAGLNELKVDPKTFAERILHNFSKELEGIKLAKTKVKPV